jgi:hypothetical protein
MSEIECQIQMCVVHAGFTDGSRRMATVAVEQPYSGSPPKPACDQCAVETMVKSAPGLRVRIISLDEWRDQLRPVAGEAMAQLRRAKSPRLALTAAQGAPQDEPAASPPDAPEAPAGAPAARAPGGTSSQQRKRIANSPALFWSLLLGLPGSFLTGIILAIAGFANNAQAVQDGIADSPWAGVATAGVLLALAPVLAIAGFLLVNFLKFCAEEEKRYRAWKKTLTPQERMAVNLAEAAALTIAHEHMKERNREQRDYHTARVMGGAQWDAYQQAQMAAIAAGHGPRRPRCAAAS